MDPDSNTQPAYTRHHTWPLPPAAPHSIALLWKRLVCVNEEEMEGAEDRGGNLRGSGVTGGVSGGGRVYVFSIPDQAQDWLNPMNREFGGGKRLCRSSSSSSSFSLIPHCLLSVSLLTRPRPFLLILPPLPPSLFLLCQTDGSQHKHLFGVREDSFMTLINKPKGNRFCKYYIFWGYRCPDPTVCPPWRFGFINNFECTAVSIFKNL